MPSRSVLRFLFRCAMASPIPMGIALLCLAVGGFPDAPVFSPWVDPDTARSLRMGGTGMALAAIGAIYWRFVSFPRAHRGMQWARAAIVVLAGVSVTIAAFGGDGRLFVAGGAGFLLPLVFDVVDLLRHRGDARTIED